MSSIASRPLQTACPEWLLPWKSRLLLSLPNSLSPTRPPALPHAAPPSCRTLPCAPLLCLSYALSLSSSPFCPSSAPTPPFLPSSSSLPLPSALSWTKGRGYQKGDATGSFRILGNSDWQDSSLRGRGDRALTPSSMGHRRPLAQGRDITFPGGHVP